MGGCQNYGPFLGPYYNTYPERDLNFDNYPFELMSSKQPGSGPYGAEALQVAGKAENRGLRALVLFKRAEPLWWQSSIWVHFGCTAWGFRVLLY